MEPDMADRPNFHHEGLLYRFGNPLEWNLAFRIALVTLIAFAFTAWTVIIARYLMGHPEIAIYVSRPVLKELLYLEERVFPTGWLLFAALGLLLGSLGKRGGGARFLAASAPIFYVLHVLTVGYCLGFFTTIYFGATLLTGLTVGMLLLEPLSLVLAMIGMVVGSILLTIAMQLR